MSAHVIYESRLELARLLVADVDQSVNHIVAQSFMLRAEIYGKRRRHIPDYLLLTDDDPVVVDVKPAGLLDDPAVAETFEWVRVVVESLDWSFEVASGSRGSWMFRPACMTARSGLMRAALARPLRSQRSVRCRGRRAPRRLRGC